MRSDSLIVKEGTASWLRGSALVVPHSLGLFYAGTNNPTGPSNDQDIPVIIAQLNVLDDPWPSRKLNCTLFTLILKAKTYIIPFKNNNNNDYLLSAMCQDLCEMFYRDYLIWELFPYKMVLIKNVLVLEAAVGWKVHFDRKTHLLWRIQLNDSFHVSLCVCVYILYLTHMCICQIYTYLHIYIYIYIFIYCFICTLSMYVYMYISVFNKQNRHLRLCLLLNQSPCNS